MLAEAFSHRAEAATTATAGPRRDRARHGHHALRGRGRSRPRSGWSAPRSSTGVEALAPYLVVDRFTLFFDFVLCLGGALAALLAGGYLPEHELDRGEFYPLLIFSTVGAMIARGARATCSRSSSGSRRCRSASTA